MTDIDVEDLLIWTFRDQRGDVYLRCGGSWDPEDGLDGGDGGGRAFDRLEWRAALGVRIDGDRSADQLIAIDPDAQHTAELVDLFGGEYRRLLMHHAQTATRPAWNVDPHPRASWLLWNVDDKERARWNRRHGVVHEAHWENTEERVPYCPFIWSQPSAGLALAQRRWRMWRQGLETVAYGLRPELGRLKRYRVTGPAAPVDPWRGA